MNKLVTPAIARLSLVITLLVATSNIFAQSANGQANANTLWRTNGNSATTSDWLGTTTSTDLIFKTYSIEQMRLTNDGRLLLGGANTQDRLSVLGSATISENLTVAKNLNFTETLQGRDAIFETVKPNTIILTILSRFQGNMNLLGGGIIRDALQVGDPQTPPGSGGGGGDRLQIHGKGYFADDVTVGGNLNVSGEATISSIIASSLRTNNLSVQSLSEATTQNAPYTLIMDNSGTVYKMATPRPDAPAIGNPWVLGGNKITNANAQYLGTSNAADIVIKTNGAEQARIAYATGNTGFGATPLSDYKFRIFTNEENKDGLHIRTKRAPGIQPVDESGDLELEMQRVTNQEYKAIAITNDLTPDAEPFVVFAEGSVKANNVNLDGVMRNKGTYVNGNINVAGGYYVNGQPLNTSQWTNNGNNIYFGNGAVIGDNSALPTGYKLAVHGKILTEEVVVKNYADWPDYVFAKNYHLISLAEVQAYIAKNKHLPGIPTAEEITKSGIGVSEMLNKQMEKIEELTLYTIDQNGKLEAQNIKLNDQNKKIEELQKQLTELQKQLNK